MTFRSALVAISCITCFSILHGQSNAASTGKDNLYEWALSATIKEMDKSWSAIDDSERNTRLRTDYHHLIVEKTDEITEELPTRFGASEVEYLDINHLTNRYRRLRKEFAILRVFPLRNDGEVLTIQISVYYFRSKRKNTFYALSDWSVVSFRYDCEKRSWILESVKLGGV